MLDTTEAGASERRAGLSVGLQAFLRSPLLRTVARRLLLSIPLMLIVSALVFVLLSILPFDAAHAILGNYAQPYEYKQLRHQLGLDVPGYEQYWHWLVHSVHGQLGNSYTSQQPVLQAILERLPTTLSLVIGTTILTVLVGVALGLISAVRRGALGRAVDAIAMVGWVLPAFWIATQLVVVFAVRLRWFPATGYVPLTQSPIDWLKSLVLPVLALSVGGIGFMAKVTREAMLDALNSEYVRVARANGLPERLIIFQHALKGAAVSVVTVSGLLVVSLLIGTVFVESVFALPGLGSLVVTGVGERDVPVVEAVVVFFTLIVVAINLVIDVTYTLLNPRVRTW